jgi:uncharacterized membrane protein
MAARAGLATRAMAAVRNRDEDRLGEPPPPGVVWLSLGLALFGLGISAYLTFVHFAGQQFLTCADNGVVNCTAVTTSAESHFLGMPVSVLGLAFYFALVIIMLPPMWRIADRRVHLLRVGLLILGMAFALYLVSAELLIIGKICLWCTGVHLVTFALFIVVMTTSPRLLDWATADTRGQGRRH